MRERQQMASRPFASVDVALEVGAEQTDFLRGPLEVGTVVLTRDHCDLHIYIASLICICFWNQVAPDYLELTSLGYVCYAVFKVQSFNSLTWAVTKAAGESISLGWSDSQLTWQPVRDGWELKECRKQAARREHASRSVLWVHSAPWLTSVLIKQTKPNKQIPKADASRISVLWFICAGLKNTQYAARFRL